MKAVDDFSGVSEKLVAKITTQTFCNLLTLIIKLSYFCHLQIYLHHQLTHISIFQFKSTRIPKRKLTINKPLNIENNQFSMEL